MIRSFSRIDCFGLIFSSGRKPFTLTLKVRVIGTYGTHGLGMIDRINYVHGTQYINIQWASPNGYDLKEGDKVKFTKE